MPRARASRTASALAGTLTKARADSRSKYGAKKVKDPVTRTTFDSKAEYYRSRELLLLERGGDIGDLEFHRRFQLKVDGTLVGSYTCDATYFDYHDNAWVVEDTKSPGTARERDYRLRIKLFQALFPQYLFREIVRRR